MELYIVIGIGVVALILFFVFLSKKTAERKANALHGIAAQMGGTYSAEAPDTFTSRLKSFTFFTQPCEYSSFSHLIHSTTEAVEKAVFEFFKTVKPAPRVGILYKNDDSNLANITYEYTVYYFKSDRLNLPHFVLTKHGFWDGIATSFGLEKDIDFESHKDFSITYNLRGADETAVRNLFNPQVLSFFENNSRISAEGHGQEIIFYSDKILTEDIPSFADKTNEAFKLFHTNAGAV